MNEPTHARHSGPQQPKQSFKWSSVAAPAGMVALVFLAALGRNGRLERLVKGPQANRPTTQQPRPPEAKPQPTGGLGFSEFFGLAVLGGMGYLIYKSFKENKSF